MRITVTATVMSSFACQSSTTYSTPTDDGKSGDTSSTQRDSSTSNPADSETTAVNEVDTEVLDEYLSTGFVPIEPGTFILGSPETESCRGALTEKQVEVTLTNRFEIGITEVTQSVWKAVGLPNPSYPKQEADLPVHYINWFDTLAFCNQLSEFAGLETCYDLSSCTGEPGTGCPHGDDPQMEGRCIDSVFSCGEVRKYERMFECAGYRLPTHAEWEYAARAGTTASTYNGNTSGEADICARVETLEPISWYCFNSNDETHPVAQKLPNPWGLFDLFGNVQEATDNVYTGFGLEMDEGADGPLTNPMGAPETADTRRSFRASDYHSEPCLLQAGWRSAVGKDERWLYSGFRPVRTLKMTARTGSALGAVVEIYRWNGE
jgi:formylglycine-generating enzyme required for sulfatase activity